MICYTSVKEPKATCQRIKYHIYGSRKPGIMIGMCGKMVYINFHNLYLMLIPDFETFTIQHLFYTVSYVKDTIFKKRSRQIESLY